jgi:hypothetical protein
MYPSLCRLPETVNAAVSFAVFTMDLALLRLFLRALLYVAEFARMPFLKHVPKYDYIVCHIYEGNMSDRLDKGEKSDESCTDLDAYYSCDDCGQGFKSHQELKEHESSRH